MCSQRDGCAPSLANAEVLPELIERGTEPGGGRGTPEAQHRVIPLLAGPVALLREVVQVLAASVPDLPTEDPADGPPLRRMRSGGHAQRLVACHLDQPSQKPPCGVVGHG